MNIEIQENKSLQKSKVMEIEIIQSDLKEAVSPKNEDVKTFDTINYM